VYALPEAQLDRFLLKLFIEYPSIDQEFRVLQTHHRSQASVPTVLTTEQLMSMRGLVEVVHVSDEIARYVVRLVRFTREHPQVSLGASPRAALALVRASKARAVIYGRDYVLPDDIKILANEVLSHRILMQPEAQLSGVGGADVVKQAVSRVRYSDPQ
jgi:MoxR-like ATPase